MRKNAEFISYLAPNTDLAKIPFTKMNGGNGGSGLVIVRYPL